MEALPASPLLCAALQVAGRKLGLDGSVRERLLHEPIIAVAVSGGADSVALLAALSADEALRPRLYVLHYDHRVRGAESAGDAHWVATLSAALGIPCEIGQREAVGPASETNLRRDRHVWFAKAMAKLGARALCLGHHLDDRMETFLLRSARGAGVEGLAAPRAIQGFRDGTFRLRPLLARRRRELRAALFDAGVPWREDATNNDTTVPRNRVRAEVIPALEATFGSTWADGAVKVADNLGEAADAFRAWLAELGALPSAAGDLSVKGLVGRPRALCRLACSELLWSHGVEDVAGTIFETMVDDVVSGRSARYTLGGIEWELAAGVLKVFEKSTGWGEKLRPLIIGGSRTESGLTAAYVKVDATLWASLSSGDILPTHEVYLRVVDPVELTWRSRLPGDRYQPLGSAGSTKVSDLLIDRKVPREVREQLPVIMIKGEVIWVPGAPPADSLRLSGPCEKALRLTWQSPSLTSDLPR